jgi:hypothetical protein
MKRYLFLVFWAEMEKILNSSKLVADGEHSKILFGSDEHIHPELIKLPLKCLFLLQFYDNVHVVLSPLWKFGKSSSWSPSKDSPPPKVRAVG